MPDNQIKTLMRVVAVSLPGNIALDEHLSTSRVGIELMLSLTLMVFPGYFAKYELYQIN